MRKRPYNEVLHSVSIIAGVSLGKLSLPQIPSDFASETLRGIVAICCQQVRCCCRCLPLRDWL